MPTGLTTYARELVGAMTTIGREHSFAHIRRPDSGPPFAEGPNVRELLKGGDASTPTLAGAISTLGLDLYHSVHHFLPIGLRAPRIVVTLHDLIWLEHPELIWPVCVRDAPGHPSLCACGDDPRDRAR